MATARLKYWSGRPMDAPHIHRLASVLRPALGGSLWDNSTSIAPH
jgi:hypothetical protein